MLFNDALDHEREDYVCQYLSTKCPFNRKKFLEKVRMGTETDVMSDEINGQKLMDFEIPGNGKEKRHDFRH